MSPTTRREFLTRAALGAGGAVVVVWTPLGCSGPPAQIDLSQVFRSPEDAVAIGERYLAQFPDESDRAALEAPLLEGVSDPSDAEALRAALAEHIRADFTLGRTFRDRSWWLSRSEGRLCALAALSV